MENITTGATTKSEKNLLQTARELGSTISQNIDDEEAGRRISRPVFNAIKEAGFLKMYLPKSLGGLEAIL